MANTSSSQLPRLTAEQRRAAAGQFERANQVIASGNLDYGLQLLLNCCTIDPANPIYRQTLRQTQKTKYQNNLKGQSLAFLTNLRAKVKMKAALKTGNYVKVLEHGEQVMMRNPWDISTSLAMARAFEELELTGLALWTLDQVRHVDVNNPKINRPLARLFEKAGNFTAAMALWELVRKAQPGDLEAQHKHKDLAASATIAKGRYENAVQGEAPSPLSSPLASSPPVKSDETAVEQQVAQQTETALPLAGASVTMKVPREVAALKAKIQANPNNPNAYLHLASLWRRADQFAEARQVLKDGLTPTANNFDLLMELTDLDIEVFRRDLAVAEEKMRQQPQSQELQNLRNRLAKEVASRELDYFRQKADRYPTDASFRFEMGVRLLKTGQIDEAIRILQAIRTDPRHQGKALVYLGFCFKSRNNWRLAQRNFEEALTRLHTTDDALRKEILFQLAQGYAESGDLNRAVDLACELANLDFSYKDIGKLLDEWNSKLQKA